MNAKSNVLKLAAVAASLAVLSGCASTKALDEVRLAAEAAKAEAAEATALASQAQGTANEAQATANEALRTANEADQDAAEANRVSEQNREEMNRMFRRTMQK
ncbi:Lpp/OprI family alanine-zipper lipoprotein [Thioalkalivibrio sp.]|uniref:Lpp/OprI family alanine-zipper lipoprotein n=1 Tax=Thioalkalivibrio sp. TaxID=2093813 RepID=UPI003562A663